MYEDFVVQYNHAGKKVQNLVLTIKWRDEYQRLQFRYINNLCSDETQKADAMYVLACWEFLLRGPEMSTLSRRTQMFPRKCGPAWTQNYRKLRWTNRINSAE